MQHFWPVVPMAEIPFIKAKPVSVIHQLLTR